jgi:hypothetical protein
MLNHGIQQLSYHQGKMLSNKKKMKNNMKTYEGKAFFCLPTILQHFPSCNNYRLIVITIMLQLPSFAHLKEKQMCLQTSCSYCPLFTKLL